MARKSGQANLETTPVTVKRSERTPGLRVAGLEALDLVYLLPDETWQQASHQGSDL